MQHDDYKFQSTEGIKLKLPPVSRLDSEGPPIALLKHSPSDGEMRNAKKRMEAHFEESKTIKNPTLLSEHLRKEYDGHSIAFVDQLPEQEDFPIYILRRSTGRFAKFEDINKVEVFYPIEDEDLYWTRMLFGD